MSYIFTCNTAFLGGWFGFILCFRGAGGAAEDDLDPEPSWSRGGC